MTDNNAVPKKVEDDEIDLLALAKTVWESRKTIVKITLIFGVIGLIVALLSPTVFTASSTIVPQTSNPQSKLGGLSSLAAMAGVNLSAATGSDMSPKLYPQIVSSMPFQLELMNTPLQFEKLDSSITLYQYYTDFGKPNPLVKYTIGLPGTLMKMIKGEPIEQSQKAINNRPLKLTVKQDRVQKRIADQVNVSVNDKDGYISISCNMPEPLAAAQLAQKTQDLLQRYITEFKIEKAKANHDFVLQRYEEAKANYQNAQEKLANFRDRNKNVSTAMAKTEEERLSGEFNLIYSVYSELAKQLEQAKIQLKEETPVFTIIEPVSVPILRTKPKRSMILIIWLFLGLIAGTGYIFGKEYWKTIKDQWSEK